MTTSERPIPGRQRRWVNSCGPGAANLATRQMSELRTVRAEMSKSPAIHKPKLRPCVIRMGETCENNCGGWAKTNQIPVSSKLWLKLRRLRVRVLTCADDGSHLRVVAQLGSALDWGSRGRWFESSPPDQKRVGRTGCFPCDLFLFYGLNRNRPQSSVTRPHVKPARACLTAANAKPVVRRSGSGSLRINISPDPKFHSDFY